MYETILLSFSTRTLPLLHHVGKEWRASSIKLKPLKSVPSFLSPTCLSEDLRLGRKPAGNRLIYFSIYLRWTEIKIILCQRLRVLDDCIRKNLLANNFLFFSLLMDWKMH